jgi:pyruvate dehydrogenase E2 component (dihydrolipoamide acetyltransferase)
MAIAVTIPRLGWDMTEGVFAGWLKQDGDLVSPGDALFSLETDKATQDVESMDAGILRIPTDGPKPGDRLAVGTAIGHLVTAKEQPSLADNGRAVAAVVKTNSESKAAPPAGPAVRRLAHALDVDLCQVQASGSSGRVTAGDVQKYHRSRGVLAGNEADAPARRDHDQPTITPRAKRLAKQRGVDWRQLKGSGRTGRIRERDVQLAGSATAPAPNKIPVSSIRKAIAERMLRSGQLTAPVTLHTTADATELVHLRNQFKASSQTSDALVPSYTDFLMKLLASALQQHPTLNARWDGDHIIVEQSIHIGIAVDTDAGLLVPVVRDVVNLGMRQLAARSRDLIDRARQRRLAVEDMQGGTFTITNLGPFGIDAFTPIINYPECAILGIGRIERRPVVVDNQVVGRDMVALSLTFDHRIVDGAPAARFLQTLCRLIANPSPALIS